MSGAFDLSAADDADAPAFQVVIKRKDRHLLRQREACGQEADLIDGTHVFRAVFFVGVKFRIEAKDRALTRIKFDDDLVDDFDAVIIVASFVFGANIFFDHAGLCRNFSACGHRICF